MGATNKVVCKTVNDTATVITNRPDLKLKAPLIQVGHPNEAAHVAAVNAAQDPPTIAEGLAFASLANQLSQIKTWSPSSEATN